MYRLQSKEKSTADVYSDTSVGVTNGKKGKQTSLVESGDVKMLVQTLPANQQHRRLVGGLKSDESAGHSYR